MFGSRAYVLKIAQDVRSSYWFIPSTLVVAALLLSELTQWIDHNPDMLPVALPDDFLNTQVDGARQTLAVIAQSIIGVTGVMFSITMVAVSFASGNFGPRLIGNFMRDRGNQTSLGLLISSFVYTLMILRAVQSSGADGLESFVPQYSMVAAILLTLMSVGTLIYFLHHIPETINVSNISAALGRRLAPGRDGDGAGIAARFRDRASLDRHAASRSRCTVGASYPNRIPWRRHAHGQRHLALSRPALDRPRRGEAISSSWI